MVNILRSQKETYQSGSTAIMALTMLPRRHFDICIFILGARSFICYNNKYAHINTKDLAWQV